MNKLAMLGLIPAAAIGLALAACGSSAPSVVTVTAPAPVVVNQNNNSAPAPVPTVTQTQTQTVPVYVPAPVAPALTGCGTGTNGEEVYAGPNTSCPFALGVESEYVSGGYWYQAGTSQFYAYSPVTGETYLMTSSSVGDPVVVTGGNDASVQFSL